MRLMLSAAAVLASSIVLPDASASRVERQAIDRSLGSDKTWTTTEQGNCWEYLTNGYWHFMPFWDGWKAPNEGKYNAHMAEFCCEFSAELVDPTCPDDNGGFPNAPAESMVCSIFEQDLPMRAILRRQARDACYCYYRSLGCDNSLLEEGGYCNYPTNEVVLDDFRFANSSLVNMCNSELEDHSDDKSYPDGYPSHFEGQSFNQCLGYCLLKRGDPNRVFKPVVSNSQCCLDTNGQGFGFELHGYEANEKKNREIAFFPAVGNPNQREYTYFFSDTSTPETIAFAPPASTYSVSISYDGVFTATMEVGRYGGDTAIHMVDEFIDCEPGQWDSLNIHVYDESPDGGIAFTNVVLDNEPLGDFGFAVKDESCPVYAIKPDIEGVYGHNNTCVSRPGGYGHVAGFELTGTVELSGNFLGDDIGLAITVGCSKPKAVKEVGCCGKTNKEVPTAWAGWLQETAYL